MTRKHQRRWIAELRVRAEQSDRPEQRSPPPAWLATPISLFLLTATPSVCSPAVSTEEPLSATFDAARKESSHAFDRLILLHYYEALPSVQKAALLALSRERRYMDSVDFDEASEFLEDSFAPATLQSEFRTALRRILPESQADETLALIDDYKATASSNSVAIEAYISNLRQEDRWITRRSQGERLYRVLGSRGFRSEVFAVLNTVAVMTSSPQRADFAFDDVMAYMRANQGGSKEPSDASLHRLLHHHRGLSDADFEGLLTHLKSDSGGRLRDAGSDALIEATINVGTKTVEYWRADWPDWREIINEEYRFAVRFPHRPIEKANAAAPGLSFGYRHTECYMTVHVVGIPDSSALSELGNETALAWMSGLIANRQELEVISDEQVLVQGYEARRFHSRVGDIEMYGVRIVTNGNLYSVVVGGHQDNRTSWHDEKERFLQTFRILEPAPDE